MALVCMFHFLRHILFVEFSRNEIVRNFFFLVSFALHMVFFSFYLYVFCCSCLGYFAISLMLWGLLQSRENISMCFWVRVCVGLGNGILFASWAHVSPSRRKTHKTTFLYAWFEWIFAWIVHTFHFFVLFSGYLFFGQWNQITTIAPLNLRWFFSLLLFLFRSVSCEFVCLPFHLTCFIPIYSHSSQTSTQNGWLFVYTYMPVFPLQQS